jgi:MYXO-CTERM domain-containing protein
MRKGLAAAGLAWMLVFGAAEAAHADVSAQATAAQADNDEGANEDDDSGKLGLLGLLGLAGLAGLLRRPDDRNRGYDRGYAGTGGGGYGGGQQGNR